MMNPGAESSVRATLNFAIDKSDGGRHSNFDEELSDQKLRPAMVEIRNARMLASAPAISREGFTLTNAPVAGADWSNPGWLESVYVPSCVELVRRLTGASIARPLTSAYLRMEDRGKRKSAKAWGLGGFVHLDGPPEVTAPHIRTLVDEATLERYPNQTIYNVWRAITPPPQGTPLAVCDRRTAVRDDMVIGHTLPDPAHPELPADAAPYLISLLSPAQQWYYFPDMTPDDALVFTSIDLIDQQHPGCPHTAFQHPDVTAAVPRVSVEARVVAFYA